MAANDFLVRWENPVDLTLTGLASLMAGNMWQSGALLNASPHHEFLEIWYELIFAGTPALALNDGIRFYLAKSDQAASNEIWVGDLGATVGAITTNPEIAAVQAAARVVHAHSWQTNHGTTFKGASPLIEGYGPSFQVVIQPFGGVDFAASGHRVRTRYGTRAYQPT